ncbi:Putative lipoprotein yfgH [Wohlfahrtiimonas chitiniclastica SH04]|uniref:Putative lipoprotein yfgH n=1 Tax=Wohlfahrtiimonas chitiniclastica SH04 TaxID=1261130 RepID=L8XUK7_9GAMM|nr:hypothetical protein [Wohlfahrtiimonas chitiniclastica]ELV07587.1 Putative lipoprotein yfgH [Wohlfahrtiimonas chitiniclastica SH04]MBS7814844.1 hypothetical protein [Wohlfahrtiimonas chitiniclastica]
MKSFKLTSLIAASAILLTACTTGENLRADVYRAGDVNQVQNVAVVTILSVTPAKVAVDNSENKKRAQLGGTLLGAIGGALIGNNHGRYGATSGGVIGGAAGAIGGSMVSDEAIVSGVSLTYKKANSNNILNSVQVGKPCEFKKGKAMVIAARKNETRIQPNNPGGCK